MASSNEIDQFITDHIAESGNLIDFATARSLIGKVLAITKSSVKNKAQKMVAIEQEILKASQVERNS
jgi:hypothetical protein